MRKALFDAEYFDRFYETRGTRVHGKKEIARLAAGVAGIIEWLGGPLESVLDIGAGPGFWRDWFRAHRPRTKYVSTDVSAYACEKYGHEQRDIARWRAKQKFDLIVCQGVLPYLDDASAASAIDNIGVMAKGYLYLEAITSRDLAEVCDLDATDIAVHPRSGDWYKEHLSRHFLQVGAGLFYKKDGPTRFYELEKSC